MTKTQLQEKRVSSMSRAFDEARTEYNKSFAECRLNFLYSLEPLLHCSEEEIEVTINDLMGSRNTILNNLTANLDDQIAWADNQKKLGVLEDPYYTTTVDSFRSLNSRMRNVAMEMINTAILILRGEY